MKQIITIGREFGSGGREIGRRLAEKLQFAYYDQEIISELAKRTHFTKEYLQRIGERGVLPLLPITVGRTLYPHRSALLCSAGAKHFNIYRAKQYYQRNG